MRCGKRMRTPVMFHQKAVGLDYFKALSFLCALTFHHKIRKISDINLRYHDTKMPY